MLNSVACKSSSKGTFWTRQLSTTIVMCGVLRVKQKGLKLINFNVKILEYMLPHQIFGTWANFKPQSLDRGIYIYFSKRSDEAKMGEEICLLLF